MATSIHRTLLNTSRRVRCCNAITRCVRLQERLLAYPSLSHWHAPFSRNTPDVFHRTLSTAPTKPSSPTSLSESEMKSFPHCHFCCGQSGWAKNSFGTFTSTTARTLKMEETVMMSVSQRSIHSCGGALYAGHNKWSKVKYIKGPKDLEKSRLFTRIGMQVKIAVKDGGPNPESNSALASLISLAKDKAMPRATMDAMIKKAATSKQGDTQQTFEVRGPGNSSLLVNVLTDNPKRTRTELTYIANKTGGTFGEQGTAMFAFQKKGVVRVSCEVEGESSMDFDEAEELAIEVGAEEVKEGTDDEGQNLFLFICDPSDLRLVRDSLHAHPVLSSGLEYVAMTTMPLSDTDMESAANLINALEEHDHVVKIFDNIVSTEE